MVLIFTGNEQLDRDLSKVIDNNRIVYYPDYVLQEKEAEILIITLQPNKFNFKDFLFKVREKNIRVILLLEDDKQKELNDALIMGIYDILLDPFSLEEVKEKIKNPTSFSKVSTYIKNILELENVLNPKNWTFFD